MTIGAASVAFVQMKEIIKHMYKCWYCAIMKSFNIRIPWIHWAYISPKNNSNLYFIFDFFPFLGHLGCSPDKDVADMTAISDIDEIGINHNLKLRYNRDQIYVSFSEFKSNISCFKISILSTIKNSNKLTVYYEIHSMNTNVRSHLIFYTIF